MRNATPPSPVPQGSLLRSFQAGAELDYILNTSKAPGFLGKTIDDTTADLAFYYQDQISPSILNVTPGTPLDGITLVGLSSSAKQIFTQKGPIRVGQFKFGFGTGKNVKFPIAVTYASRTELLTHHTWGVNFGVTYDFTSLFSGSGSQLPEASSRAKQMRARPEILCQSKALVVTIGSCAAIAIAARARLERLGLVTGPR